MRASASLESERAALARRARALLGAAVRAGWERRLLSRDPDGLFSSVPGADDVKALLDGPPDEMPSPGDSAGPPVERLAKLCDSLGLSPAACELVGLALAVEVDPVSRALAGYLRGQPGALTVGALAMVLGDAATPALLVELAAGAPLRRHRLVDVVERAGELYAGASVRAAPRLARWLVDPAATDDEVAELARLELPDGPAPTASVAALIDEAVGEVCAFLERQRSRRASSDLLLRGPRGAGRGEIAREACRRLGLPLLAAHAGTLLGQEKPVEAAALLLREALLLDAQVFVEGAEALLSESENAQRLRSALGGSAKPLVLAASGLELPRLGRAVVVRDVRIAETHQREGVWRELLPEVRAGEIASLYRLGVGAMARVADGARLRAQVRGQAEASHADVAQAVRSEFATDLGTLATRVDVSQTWEDLVVSDETGRTIAELVDQLRHRATVLGRWGFQRKLGKGLGTTALFSGEPGTGKSMVAGLIARELGLELYQIDLSRVLSKWIGETEKNLSRVFDAAETGHVVLLFDEADALLGKRTADVKGANDRYANIETNFILQRLEAFHGVAILTSNLESSIDPALSRRLSFELRFPFPDVDQRDEIWRRMLPAELPVEGEIDYKTLATRFELAGGHIRNIVLRAAYLAAADADALTMQHLLRAAEYEYRDHGMLVAKGRLSR